jgi:hypothetical protein
MRIEKRTRLAAIEKHRHRASPMVRIWGLDMKKPTALWGASVIAANN